MSKQTPPAPTGSTIGPCPTIIQIVGSPGTGSLPKTWRAHGMLIPGLTHFVYNLVPVNRMPANVWLVLWNFCTTWDQYIGCLTAPDGRSMCLYQASHYLCLTHFRPVYLSILLIWTSPFLSLAVSRGSFILLVG